MERVGILMADGAGREHFRAVLAVTGFEALPFRSVTALLRSWRRDDGRLIFIDVDLPGEDWQGVFAQLHEAAPHRAVVVGLGGSAPSASMALDAGADEFVALPCRAPELAARVQAALRRATPVPARDEALCWGPCQLDVAARQLVGRRGRVELTHRETALAQCLFQSAGGVVLRRRLAYLWEADEAMAGRSIDQHVYQLRRKLKRCVGDAVVLRSVYARGYQFDVLAASATAAESAAAAR